MRVKKQDIWENDGSIRVDITLIFEKSIMISPMQLEVLKGIWDSDVRFLNGKKKSNGLDLEANIESIDQIPKLESELREIIARCQIAETERIKQDKLLYENVKATLDKILSPYIEKHEEDDNDC